MTLRLNAIARDISGLVEPPAATRDPAFTGCVLMPWAGVVLAGTTCRRPLLFNEGEALARYSGLDLVLLRFDAERGVTFDVRLQRRNEWLFRYISWRLEGEIWLIPEGSGPFLRMLASGIELENEAPFLTRGGWANGIVSELDSSPFQARH